jgi:hypothetical protein
MIFTLNPTFSSAETARDIRRGKMSLSRDEGDSKATVSPRRRAGGKIPASMEEVMLLIVYKMCLYLRGNCGVV